MSNSNASAAVQPSKAAIEHVTVATGVPYEKLVAAFEAELGRLDPAAVQALVERRASWGEVEREIQRVGGTHGLMIVASANQGAVISLSGKAKRCVLYLVGNPVIAHKIIAIDIRASFCVPFRVLCSIPTKTAPLAMIAHPRFSLRLADPSLGSSAPCSTRRSMG